MGLDETLEYVKTLTEDKQRVFELGVNSGKLQHHVGAVTRHYTAGWNAALDLIAFKLIDEFKTAFGNDTLAGIAIWIKEQKK
jgi:hypothetical protein